MKRYLYTTIRFFIFFVISAIIFFPARAAVDSMYNALCEWFPGLFPEYNFITDREAAAAHEAWADFIASIISIVITTVISEICDNRRFEYVISETDGFYTIKEGFKIYTGTYLLPDAIASLILPLPIISLSLIRNFEVKNAFVALLNSARIALLRPTFSFVAVFGFSVGLLLLPVFLFITKVISAVFGLRKWRATWLSDIGR